MAALEPYAIVRLYDIPEKSEILQTLSMFFFIWLTSLPKSLIGLTVHMCWTYNLGIASSALTSAGNLI